jgi:hypothetical protein
MFNAGFYSTNTIFSLEKLYFEASNFYECEYKRVQGISMVNILLQLFLNVITTKCWLSEISSHVHDMILVIKRE